MTFISEWLKWYRVYRGFNRPLRAIKRAFFMARMK